MKKLFILLALILMGSFCVIADEPENYVEIFEKDKIIDIKIEISDADLQSIYENPQLEEYHPANITIDGVSVSNIGIRTKGNSSLNSVARSESDRYSYRIKFNKYEKGQKLLGLDEMVINNMFSDPSYMREYLSYEAMREAGMNAPLSVFANIYINDELKGFYLAVESIEDAFLDRTFGNNDGNLYKQEQGSTLLYSQNSDYAASELKSGKDTEKTALKNMIKVLNEKGDYESVLDIESCLALIAANTVLGSYDSYNGQFAHNYYLYEQDGIVSAIPWDYNMSLGGFSQGGSGWTISLDTPVSGVSLTQRPLINNLLEISEYKEKYLEYVNVFAGYLEKMPERVAALADIIRPYVDSDPTKFTTMEGFENSIIYVEEQERTGMQRGEFSERGNMEMQLPEGFLPENMPMRGNMGEPGQRPAGELPEGEANTRGNMGGRGQRPQGEMPEGNIGGRMPEMQRPEGVSPENMPNGRMGGGMGMGMNGGSIITYAVKRLENISSQLGGSSEIKVLLNDSRMEFDVSPIIENGRTLVPLRAVFEALGMEVTYENGDITAKKDMLIINLTINNKIAYVNNQEKTLDVAGKIVDGRTLVPLRFIGEATGLTVNYDGATKTITMNNQN